MAPLSLTSDCSTKLVGPYALVNVDLGIWSGAWENALGLIVV
jgi:hypothetical protein